MTEHPTADLAVLALGVLPPEEAREVETHVAGCGTCQAELAELRGTAALLDGLDLADFTSEDFTAQDLAPADPSADDPQPIPVDLLLARTLRQVRADRSISRRRFGGALVGVAAAALVVGGIGVSALRPGTDEQNPPIAAPATPAAGTFVLTGSDTTTGASADVTVEPAGGGSWVRLSITVSGIDPGERCRVVVVSTSGERIDAGSWTVAPPPPGSPRRPLQMSASVPLADVASVEVETFAGKPVVSLDA